MDDVINFLFLYDILCKQVEHQWKSTPLYCAYHILTLSVIYYRPDKQQHGIYLFIQ